MESGFRILKRRRIVVTYDTNDTICVIMCVRESGLYVYVSPDNEKYYYQGVLSKLVLQRMPPWENNGAGYSANAPLHEFINKNWIYQPRRS